VRENDADVKLGLRTLNEVEALNLCISKYFKGKSESSPLKKDESLILSALTIYFHGVLK
jgi:hypothetical protein